MEQQDRKILVVSVASGQDAFPAGILAAPPRGRSLRRRDSQLTMPRIERDVLPMRDRATTM